MSQRGVTESVVEEAALAWLEAGGWQVAHGPDISPSGDTLTPALSQWERESYSDVVLEGRLRDALARLNPDLPAEALEDAFRKLTRPRRRTLSPTRTAHLRSADARTSVQPTIELASSRPSNLHSADH